MANELRGYEGRFWAKVHKTAKCWLWTGATSQGYGRATSPPNLITQKAHRISYFLIKGELPELELDHLCRNRACVNPDHLEPVTHAENQRRMAEAITHCPAGHAYDEANTYRRANGDRRCRACGRERMRAKRAALRGDRTPDTCCDDRSPHTHIEIGDE